MDPSGTESNKVVAMQPNPRALLAVKLGIISLGAVETDVYPMMRI